MKMKSQYLVALGYIALGERQGKSSPKLKETGAQVSASNKQICPPAY